MLVFLIIRKKAAGSTLLRGLLNEKNPHLRAGVGFCKRTGVIRVGVAYYRLENWKRLRAPG